MPNARANPFSVLLGQQLNIAGLAAREAKPDFLLHALFGFDFALTDFGMGTLLWMQSPRRENAMPLSGAFATNIAASSMYNAEPGELPEEHRQTPADGNNG